MIPTILSGKEGFSTLILKSTEKDKPGSLIYVTEVLKAISKTAIQYILLSFRNQHVRY